MFSKEIKNFIENTEIGDRYFFFDIEIEDFEGSSRKLQEVGFKIK